MSGTIKIIIEKIIAARAKGNVALAQLTEAKLILRGVNPADFTDKTPDDASILEKIKTIAQEMGVVL